MDSFGKYLYCIIRCAAYRTFQETGIGGGPVHTVSESGLAAVVSDSPSRNHERTRRNLIAHERVLEEVTRDFDLLPVRFGTVTDFASPEGDVKRLLANRRQEFDGLLTELEGKEELGLRAFWRDEHAIFSEIMAENSGLRRLKESLSGKSETATRFERIRLGEMVKENLERKKALIAARILAAVRDLAFKTRENEVLGDRMILNAAFLVEKSREPEFDQAVAALDREFGDRIIFRYIGQAPPYNFVNIAVNWQELE